MATHKNDYPYDDYGFERYEENIFPIAYLLTFTTYGTWLHGDERGSHQRSRDKRFGTIKREPNVPKVWTRGASTRYLWKPAHVEAAIDYVLYSQGDDPVGTVF